MEQGERILVAVQRDVVQGAQPKHIAGAGVEVQAKKEVHHGQVPAVCGVVQRGAPVAVVQRARAVAQLVHELHGRGGGQRGEEGRRSTRGLGGLP